MGFKVMIVDDATFIREIFKTIAMKQGWVIVGEAENGEQAIKVALETKPDVILMDIVMPKKSGIEATKAILEAIPSTKIVACSTVDQDTVLMRAIEAGCVSYVTKPFKSEEVINAISSALNGGKA